VAARVKRYPPAKVARKRSENDISEHFSKVFDDPIFDLAHFNLAAEQSFIEVTGSPSQAIIRIEIT